MIKETTRSKLEFTYRIIVTIFNHLMEWLLLLSLAILMLAAAYWLVVNALGRF